MKNFRLNFESIVQNKARWLLTIIAILTIGVGQMWGYYISSNTTLYFYEYHSWGSVNLYIWSDGKGYKNKDDVKKKNIKEEKKYRKKKISMIINKVIIALCKSRKKIINYQIYLKVNICK